MAGRGLDERWAKARGIKGRDGPSPTPEVRLPEPKIAAVERRRACASVVSSDDAGVARRLRDKRRHACRAVRILLLMRRSALRSPRGTGESTPEKSPGSSAGDRRPRA